MQKSEEKKETERKEIKEEKRGEGERILLTFKSSSMVQFSAFC